MRRGKLVIIKLNIINKRREVKRKEEDEDEDQSRLATRGVEKNAK